MTNEEKRQRAQDFIDGIIAINKKYGMGSTTPTEVYERAVDAAANAYSDLVQYPQPA